MACVILGPRDRVQVEFLSFNFNVEVEDVKDKLENILRNKIQKKSSHRTRTNTLPMAVGTRGERRRLSPKTSARACAVWCNAMTARFL